MPTEYPAERYARLRLTDRAAYWRTGKVIPHKAPLEKDDPLEAYGSFLFDSPESAERAHAEDMVKMWEMVADGELTPAEAYGIDEIMGIFECTVDADGRIAVVDPGSRPPTIAEQRAGADRRFGPDGGFELSREDVFAAYGVHDPLAAPSPSI